MSVKLYSPTSRIAFAIGISVLLHSLLLWVPNIELAPFKSSLPPLAAKLEALPGITAQPGPNIKASPAQKPKAKKHQSAPAQDIPLAASSVAEASSVSEVSSFAEASSVVEASSIAEATSAAASAPTATETLAQSESVNTFERPPLPRRAQLTFAVFKGTSDFKIGESMHTLEINDGHYELKSVTETVGLAKLVKAYKLTQYSSGSYSRQGLQPEYFFEERAERLGTQRNTLELDHTAQQARFSHGGVAALPPDTQDILSILYQFPPLDHAKTVPIIVGNSKKIEQYEFEVVDNEDIRTAMGKLHTVHLRKLHRPNEDGLEIWLALEYRLFPVKLRIIERNGEISGESIIIDMRAEFEEEIKKDVDH